MVYSATTTKYVFAMQPGDVFWCTADCGWITGHSYLTYGGCPALPRPAAAAVVGTVWACFLPDLLQRKETFRPHDPWSWEVVLLRT